MTISAYVIVAVPLVMLGLLIAYPVIKEIIEFHRTPTEIISALPSEGLFRTSGKANSTVIKSPITQSDCVWWQVEIQSSSGENSWKTIYKDTSKDYFEINDGTGKIRLPPTNANFVIRNDIAESSGFLKSMDPQFREVIEKMGIDTTYFKGYYKQLRVHERVIEPEDEIFVFGEIGYQDGIKTFLPREDAQDTTLVINDSDGRNVVLKLYGRATSLVFGTVILT